MTAPFKLTTQKRNILEIGDNIGFQTGTIFPFVISFNRIPAIEGMTIIYNSPDIILETSISTFCPTSNDKLSGTIIGDKRESIKMTAKVKAVFPFSSIPK